MKTLGHFLWGVLVVACVSLGRPAFATEVIFQLPPRAQGLDGHLTDASLSVQAAAGEESTPQDILAAAQADYARMVSALYEVGRYGAVVSILVDGREAADISPFDAPPRIGRVLIRVEPGPLFTFSTTRLAPLAPGTRLPEEFRPGKPAFSELIGDAISVSATAWREAGHAKVSIADQRIAANHRNARLSAEITLAPGPRLRFGNLVVTKPGNVRPERIRAIAGLPAGKIYHPDEVEQASRRLRRTGAFRSVVLEEANAIGPGNTLDVNATLSDAKPRRFGFGAEISSLEGLSVSSFWLHRNLFGGAERLRIEGEVKGIGGDSGGIDYEFLTRFERPATFNADTDFFAEIAAKELNEPDYRERNIRAGVGLHYIFSEELTGEIAIAYQYSDIDDAFGSRQLEHLFLPARLTYDTRDEPLDATEGAFLDLEVIPFAGLDNDGLGARVLLDARNYQGFGSDDRFVFATRAQIGTVNGASFTEIPPGMLFFSGGAGTVRGQPYQSLGIPVAPGLQVGGRSFAALSAELRAQVKDKWSAVAFADAGFVGADSWWDEGGQTHYGAGLGVRYDTGLGPIRVDLATPLGSNAGEEIELYIGIGQAF